MDVQKEHNLNGYPTVISYECTKKIIEQMDKNICRIKIDNIQCTGFFCKIPFPDHNKILPVLITSSHVINEEFLNKDDAKIVLEIGSNPNVKELNLKDKNKIIYTNSDYDITLIELKAEDNISDFLELDDIIVDDIISGKNKNEIFIEENIYILEYVKGELNYSTGILRNIYEDNKYHFIHTCGTGNGSGGSPILNVKTNRVIGLHHSSVMSKRYGRGTFLNYPLKEFISIFIKQK